MPLHAVETLTWDSCVQEVITNNLDLKTARENVNVYKYRRKGLWSEYMPEVTAGLNTSYNGGSNASGNNPWYSASLTVSQNIFNGFQSVGKLRESEGNLEAKEASYQSARAAVGYNLMVAYAQVLYAKNYVKLSQDIIKRRTENLNLVKLL